MAAQTPKPNRMPSSFDYDPIDEPGLKKLMRKLREEPLVFLGLGLTVAALVNAARAIKRRDSWAAQRYFRARVGAQFFTVMAVIGGGIYYSDSRIRNRDARRAKAELDAEQKRIRWIRELDIRDAEDKRQMGQLRTKPLAPSAKPAPVPRTPINVGSGDGDRVDAAKVSHTTSAQARQSSPDDGAASALDTPAAGPTELAIDAMAPVRAGKSR